MHQVGNYVEKKIININLFLCFDLPCTLNTQQLEFSLEPEIMTILAQFCQDCIVSLLKFWSVDT